MSAPERKRWPREIGLAVAEEIVALLEPACASIIVAGSLRRGKPDVGDVEILYIPLLTSLPDPADFFAIREANCAEILIGEMLESGVLTKRLSANGREAWGDKNKLARHVATGMPVDLFAATRENWFNYLVCRTGPAESNIRIAQRAQQMGWKRNPYGAGFTRGGHDDVDFEEYRVTSEEGLFRFLALPYDKPEDRK